MSALRIFRRSAVLGVARVWPFAGVQLKQRPHSEHVICLKRGGAQLTAKREQLAELLLAGWRPVDLNRDVATAIDQDSGRPASLDETRSESVQPGSGAVPEFGIIVHNPVDSGWKAAVQLERAGDAA